MQIISPKVLQISTTILQLKVYISYVVQKLVGHPPLQECPDPEMFVYHQFLLFFSHEV